VRDFDWLNQYWSENTLDEEEMFLATEDYGDKLINELLLPIAVEPLDAGQSKFFKTVYQNPTRDNSNQFLDRET
jgi:hypothetical protein